jgi:prefoldin alpha subunit
MSALTVGPELEITPWTMSIEELNSLKTQLDTEIQDLQKQLESLSNGKSRFINARETVDDISKSSNSGDSLLIPLTSSLYVPGRMVDPSKVCSILTIHSRT